MSWIYLILAGLAEIGFATFLKLSEQFTKLIPSVGFVLFGALSFYLMGKAMKDISMPLVYSVWSGIGIAGIALIEIVFFNEPLNFVKIFFIFLILVGILGLKLV